MPTPPSGAADVLHGFEAGVAATRDLLRGRHIVVLTTAQAAEEFVPGLLPDAQRLLGDGGDLRLLLLGTPSADILTTLDEAKVPLRFLEEPREFGFLASEQEALLWPLEQPSHSVLREVTLHVRDPPFLAHVLLAFERAWGRARPR